MSSWTDSISSWTSSLASAANSVQELTGGGSGATQATNNAPVYATGSAPAAAMGLTSSDRFMIMGAVVVAVVIGMIFWARKK